jgi:hypothetical protein
LQIHLFISKNAQAENRLKTILDKFAHAFSLIQYYSAEAFGQVLPRTYGALAVALIMVSDEEELRLLAERKDTWHWFKTILVIPDDKPGTINLCHSLSPSFIADMDSDFSDVEAVLKKMVKNYSENNNQIERRQHDSASH